MYLLSRDNWSDRILDYYRPPGQLRITVSAWAIIKPITGLYFIRPRNWWILWGYLREYGLRSVIRKVSSRLRETMRNEKFVSAGVGIIQATDDPEEFPVDASVIFIAPAHPKCVERIVLPAFLVRPVSSATGIMEEDSEGIRFYGSGPILPHLDKIIGWSPYSGREIPVEPIEESLSVVAEYWSHPPEVSHVLPLPRPSRVMTFSAPRRPLRAGSQLSAVLFGLGNYAKTQILPNLDPRIRVVAIHELDPTQINEQYRRDYNFSTDPGKEAAEYDVCLIVSYHHTHAELAIRALRLGAVAVVEKPVVTNRRQLEELISTLRGSGGRLFSCYQMRYNPLFALARRDLRQALGEPIHVTSDVYEMPLPPYHWYRWPNSGSHLINNGTHWLDHFLFMNDYSPPIRSSVTRAQNGDTGVTVELANGACLFLHLTHIGSPRIGVQRCVVMRKGDRTVTVTDDSRYRAEDNAGIIRKRRINEMEVFRRMYREISRKIIAGESGDSIESIERTNGLLLDLEEKLQRQLRGVHNRK